LSVDDAEARGMPGVIDVVMLPDVVAVVAKSLWATLMAHFVLIIEWIETAPARAFHSIDTLEAYAAVANDGSAAAATWTDKGDASAAIAAAGRADVSVGLRLSQAARADGGCGRRGCGWAGRRDLDRDADAALDDADRG